MGTMKEYLQWRGDISFNQVESNPVDSLIFATVCYIHLNNIMPADFTTRIRIDEVKNAYEALPKEEQGIVRRKTDVELLDLLCSSRRFCKTKVMAHVEEINLEDETQFAAITYILEDGTVHVTFRGTDNTVPGWKEDFNMTFMEEVPGQGKAVRYLEKVAEVTEGPIVVAGHSKGGNLSVYSSIKCNTAVQDRIMAVYSFDGPGFMTDILNSDECMRIKNKIHSFVPNSSMVGMLLNHVEDNVIVKSNNPNSGFLQHDPYSWEILAGGFICAEELANSSYLTDTSFKAILSELTQEERKLLADHIFESFNGGDVKYLADVFSPSNIAASIKGMQDIPKERQHVIKEAKKKLMSVLYENFKENIKENMKR